MVGERRQKQVRLDALLEYWIKINMATSYRYVPTETRRWTYGAELELVDWPCREPLLPGMAIDENERANVNSNGVAVDGRGKLYHLGGEILTAPSIESSGPAEQLSWVKSRWPEATCNFRTGVNIHIRVPRLRDDLKKLKRLQTFIHCIMPDVLPVIDAIPKPSIRTYPKEQEYVGAKRDYLRCRRNHHTLMSGKRIELQMRARTPKEFFEAEAIHIATGRIYWATVARACVNLRQLLQTDTVEFRHFPGSDSPAEVLNVTQWCKMFLEAAFDGSNISAQELLSSFDLNSRSWPKHSPYVYWLDEGYFYTSRFYNPPATVPARIEAWLAKKDEQCPRQ
jgi:hypothetical protein